MVLFTPKKVGDRVVIHAMKNQNGRYEAHEVEWGATAAH